MRILNSEKLDIRLKHLQEEHKSLDDQVDALERTGNFEDSKLLHLKKKRLNVKDEIDQVQRKINANNEANKNG